MTKENEKGVGTVEMLKCFKELSSVLHGMKMEEDTHIVIMLDDLMFKKVDEDLYYRQNPEGTDFVPSDEVIELNVGNMKILFQKK